MEEESSNTADRKHRIECIRLSGLLKNTQDNQKRAQLLREAIEKHNMIVLKNDDDLTDLAMCYYQLGILNSAYLDNSELALKCFCNAINSLKSIKHPGPEDIELINVYKWHIDKISSSVSVITDDLHTDSDNQGDTKIQSTPIFKR